jgi:predicted O-methyltransferase YrrM
LKKDDDISRKQYYQQVEALLSIYSSLQISYPLPDTRGWAASPDILKKIMETTLREKPAMVLEASSGISTLIIAYCLKQIGSGKVISLENDAKFAKISEDMVALHGLSDIVTVVHAPLTEVKINGKQWLWYDAKAINIDAPIDLFVIDGPPASTQHLARYPALPLMFDFLADDATIILDDGARKAETEIVTKWGEELEGISYEFLDLEKGAYVIKKHVKIT